MTFAAADAWCCIDASIRRNLRPDRTESTRRCVVRSLLFASGGGDHEGLALQQAAALARSLRVGLHVLQVVKPRAARLSAVARLLGILPDDTSAPRESEAREVNRWCNDILTQPLPETRTIVRLGDFVQEVARHCAGLDDPLVVLSPSIANLGATATRLACASSQPVMVVRAQGKTAKVLAATDLDRDDSVVVQRALALGHQLGTSVLAMHNLSSISMAPSLGSPALAPLVPPPVLDARPGAAIRAQSRAPLPTIMTNEPNAVKAIVEEARARRVRMIVVGTSARSWFERLVRPSVAARVVQRADRTVLVAPRTLQAHARSDAAASQPGASGQRGPARSAPSAASA